MTRRDPFREIEQLFERMSREFEELGGTLDGPMPPLSADVAVDVAEDDESILVTADLPGYEREEIDVELHDEALTIAATHTEESETNGDEAADEDAESTATDESDEVHYHVRERTRRSVSRRVPLPAAVEHDGASATYNNGVLTVTLPKRTATDSDGHTIDVS